ncbi:alpha/beta hydrolase family protein [Dactylosporangium sp. CA-152071]|uniref:alpha/beta hydrolase family protein n=1 Tax=Dactylosporangium sp. CA-152071 TaxID=3239933 RepID=UPI003D8C8854
MRLLRHTMVLGLVLVVGASSAAAAVAQPERGGDGRRGEVVAVQPLRELNAGGVRDVLGAAQFDAGGVRHGVEVYQVLYRTVDAQQRATVASGLLALPRNGERQLRVVSYAHGTELNRTDAPSMWRDGWAVAPALTYASAGFAAVAPDYLGMGLGPGPHPFLDVTTEASASLDLLRAARTVAAGQGRTLRREVYATGFSQGGSAATALGQALERGGDGWFRLGALAPIAGAYDARRVELPALIGGTVAPPYNVGYTAYLVVAWNRLHGLYQRPEEFFAAPYAGKVEALFDGVHTGEDLAATLPGTPEELFTPRGLAVLRAPSGPFADALAVHDASCDGIRAPARLLVDRADEQVPVANSTYCATRLRAGTVVDVGTHPYNGSAHLGANIAGTAAALAWFRQLG